MKVAEDVVLRFVTRNLSTGLQDFRNDESLAAFFQLVQAGKDIAAAQEYQRVTGAELTECHLAVTVARSLS